MRGRKMGSRGLAGTPPPSASANLPAPFLPLVSRAQHTRLTWTADRISVLPTL